MFDRLFPSAVRELRSELTSRPAIVGMIAVGVILGISGPFDTLRVLPAVPRVLYWIIVVFVTYSVGTVVSTIVHQALKHRANWFQTVIAICANGTVLTAVLTLLNLLAFGIWPNTFGELLERLWVVTLISGVIEVGGHLLRNSQSSEAKKAVPLLDRLPVHKRGPLIALNAEDHYVRVTTTKGEELVLMRLSDAVKEVGDTSGLQIHRSHWVATDQIKEVNRSGDRGEMLLSDGGTRPISRGYMGAVREAGLLPRGRNG